MDEHKEYYSPDEVAQRLNLHVRTVRRYIREGRLKATRIGKQYRITARDLDDLVGEDQAGSTDQSVGRQRLTLVSTTVDIEAIGPDETYRITTALSGAFNADQARSSRKRVDCIYYEEQGRLRIIVNAELETATAILGMVSFVLADGRSA